MPLLDIDDIQGGLIAGYPTTHAAYVFVRFDKVTDDVRRWLGGIGPTDARARLPRAAPDAVSRNIAFTASGMQALGLPGPAVHALPPAFREGMAARAHLLGDSGPSGPGKWEAWATAPVDALVTVTAGSSAARQHAVDRICHDGVPFDDEHAPCPREVEVVHVQLAQAITEPPFPDDDPGLAATADGRVRRFEPFGFRDGVSNPVIEGSDRECPAGSGTLRAGRWHPIKPGEFVLGYEDETRIVDLPRPLRPWFRNGSYVVWRKLRQDVDAFQALPMDRQVALVGRKRDGTPLLPPRSDGTLPTPEDNGFTYADDRCGEYCPVSAHIRRTNPRAATDFADVVTSRHRIIRRGMPYDDLLPSVVERRERGLVFVCFNADLERQFEFVQSQWVVGDPSRRGSGERDPIAAPNGDESLATLVTTRAGAYLFQPGLLGMQRLVHASGGGGS